MSKMSELSVMIDNLISCGETLAETGRALKEFYSGTEEIAPAKPEKKEAAHPEVFVQYGPNGEASVEAVVERIKNEYAAQGHRLSSIKSMKVYVKPEERSAYYVINEKTQGRVDLF